MAYATCTSDIARLTTLRRRREAPSVRDRQPPPMNSTVTHLRIRRTSREHRRIRESPAVRQKGETLASPNYVTSKETPQSSQGRVRTNYELRRAQATQHYCNRHGDSNDGLRLSAPETSLSREFAGPGEHWASKATLGTPSTKNH